MGYCVHHPSSQSVGSGLPGKLWAEICFSNANCRNVELHGALGAVAILRSHLTWCIRMCTGRNPHLGLGDTCQQRSCQEVSSQGGMVRGCFVECKEVELLLPQSLAAAPLMAFHVPSCFQRAALVMERHKPCAVVPHPTLTVRARWDIISIFEFVFQITL